MKNIVHINPPNRCVTETKLKSEFYLLAVNND